MRRVYFGREWLGGSAVYDARATDSNICVVSDLFGAYRAVARAPTHRKADCLRWPFVPQLDGAMRV